MDSLLPMLVSYPAIGVVAAVGLLLFIIMIVKKTVRAIVMLVFLFIVTIMVVVKVGVVDKKEIAAIQDTVKEHIEDEVKKRENP